MSCDAQHAAAYGHRNVGVSRGGGGCLGADLCCKRVSHPGWNEGLLRAAATEAAGRIEGHATCRVGEHTLLMLACFT